MALSKPSPSDSEAHTEADPFHPFAPNFGEKLGIGLFHVVNKILPWYKLPGFLGAFNLAMLRLELRQFNLHDSYASPTAQSNAIETPVPDERYRTARHSDGKFNSIERPLMGCAGMRFGRNFPRSETSRPTDEELMTPNPRMISDKFMARKEGGFIPATTLNLLAAAWIQFQIHDWFNHQQSDKENIEIPIPPEGHPWPHGKTMTIPRTKPDAIRDHSDVKCPGYINENTSWWDGSQIYGSSEAATQKLRSALPDGKLALDSGGREAFLPRDKDGNVLTGFNNNWWTGMEMLHTLFALEHNAICDALRSAYPSMTSDEIFDKARLVNCALMAKIHTVEWTPAILAHPALEIGMNANWWGLAGEKITKLVGRLSKSDIISGIPGSGAHTDGAPYSLTEEFVSVYRMHSLMPDNIAFFSAKSGSHLTTLPLPSLTFTHARDPLLTTKDPLSFSDILYSFGINYPGAITNNNYPSFLRNLTTPDGRTLDLGTLDILRDRERGVPRYCAFRRGLRLSVPKTFLELTGGNNALATELSDAYNGDIELVDALVGSHSEPVIPGFGFSETAFRIFILMASRRLSADRFIAEDWNEKTYTKVGFRWVQHTGMKDILARHYPQLRETLAKTKGNVFAPWAKMEASNGYKGVETNAPKA